MFILDHISITVKDIEKARPFYDAIMGALGVDKVYDHPDALGYGVRCSAGEELHSYLRVCSSPEANNDRRRHWCFKASTRSQVVAFYEAALGTGGLADGPPGLRPHYHANYFGAFVIDPSGNRVEAVCHRAE